MNDQFLTELQNVMGGSGIFMEEPMKKHTTFRVGGPADVLVQPDETALAAILALCRQYHVSYSFIGNGSNLLVGDKGIRGVVIEMTDPMGNIEVDGTKITAQAGAMLSKIANTAASNGLGGMEFAAGIPGSVGGAVVMNAGAYGGEMKDIIEKVYVLDENGAQLELDRDALDLGYRHSCIPEKKYIVTKVVLELVPRNEAEIRSEMKELNEKRAEKQPLQYPSAGSTFKRPEGYFAGKLIMDAGLRGYQVGGAQVSEKHCGFVINKGDATAADICQLMRDVSDKVQAQYIPNKRTIYVRNGMSENATFHSISRELACASLDHHDGSYSRAGVSAQAYCAAYVTAQKYGVDVSGFSFDKVCQMQAFGQKDPKELRSFIQDVKSAAYSIGKQVDRNLGKSEQEFMTDEFAIPEEKTEKPAKSKKSPER